MMRIWLAGVVAGVSLAAGADVWEVSTTVPDSDGLVGVHALTNAIAKACAASADVKTIRLGPGTYDLSTLSERAYANSWGTACSIDDQGIASLLVGTGMTFEGTDPTPWAEQSPGQASILKGSDAMRIFYGYTGGGRACVFRHLTFDGGKTTGNGGAIMFSGTEFGGYATNCVFRNCSALTGGATHEVTAWSCLYENNTASKGGGAFGTQANTSRYLTNSFDNCIFRYNTATGTGGGGLYVEKIDRLNDVQFIGNAATGESGVGGGIYAQAGNPIVDRCLFVSNTCNTTTERNFQAPGLSRFRGCTFTGRFGVFGSDFERCTFENCESTVNGNTEGFLTVNADGRIANCLFANCRAVKLIANIGHRLDVANCTFADSVVSGYVFWTFRNGGTNIDYTGIPATNEIVNCIFAGNTVAGVAKDVNFYVTGTGVPKASANFVNNIVYMRDAGGVWANVTDGKNFKKVADVKFVGADNADYPAAPKYMILRDSPAFDAGIRQAWMTGASDLAGKPRIFGKEVDIGCYECDLSPLSYLFLFD